MTSRRARSSAPLGCQFPACTARASSTVKPARIIVAGLPVEVERLCSEHRRILNVRAARAVGSEQKRQRVRRSVYTCHGCGQTFGAYAPAERCASGHGGARISIEGLDADDSEQGSKRRHPSAQAEHQ